MLVLFIDGPWEGKSFAAENPDSEYNVPIYEPSVIERSKKDVTPMGHAVYREIHRYQSPSGKKVLLYSSDKPR
jgi:hypothetical protein